MKCTHIITTDNEDQGWLDSFNDYSGDNYKMNETIEPSSALKHTVEKFNHEIACGPAIRIVEIEKPYSDEHTDEEVTE